MKRGILEIIVILLSETLEISNRRLFQIFPLRGLFNEEFL